MPGCATRFELRTAEGKVIAAVAEHHQTHWRMMLSEPVITTGLELVILDRGPAPPAILEVHCA